MKKVVTHNANFHADDVFATATLDLVFDGKIEVFRSRDLEIIESGDIVYDVGGIYDPEKNRFDHHQTEGAGERENGVPYAAFGLIWKHFGSKLVSSDEILEKVDEKIVQPIDANDTGYMSPESKIPDLDNYVVDTLIKSFNPTWSESYDDSYEKFIQLVSFAKEILKREIKKAEDSVLGKEKVIYAYNNAEDKRIIVLDRGYSWRSTLTSYPEPEFVIFPAAEKGFMIQAVHKGMSGYDTRNSFPETWRGKNDKELDKVSGIENTVFCHRAGFLAGNETLEDAIKMAEMAVSK